METTLTRAARRALRKASELREGSLADHYAADHGAPAMRRRANVRWYAAILLDLRAKSDARHAQYAAEFVRIVRERARAGWWQA